MSVEYRWTACELAWKSAGSGTEVGTETRVQLGFKSFPQANPNDCDFGSGKCTENTRYCGLNLTCPIDSGIFPSAAVNERSCFVAGLDLPPAGQQTRIRGISALFPPL